MDGTKVGRAGGMENSDQLVSLVRNRLPKDRTRNFVRRETA